MSAHVTGIIVNLPVDRIEDAADFYTGFLGLSHQDMGLDWVTRFTDRASGASVQVVTHDATAPEDSSMTVKVDAVDAAYADAQARGYEIVHPLTDEEWGIRRFFVRAPGGAVVNIAQHRA
jgi:predicted enzyme related to lactoylglutathione lyase